MPAVSINRGFFELGGHSLLALRLISTLRERFDLDISPIMLFQGSTVEQVAALIDAPKPNQRSNSPVCLSQVRQGPAFFAAHPVGGSAACYAALSEVISGDLTVYGLEDPRVYGWPDTHARLEDMAAVHLEAVRSVQPSGPYLLGGWSFGGVLAYEMANQAAAAGEEVPLLLLIDSFLHPGPAAAQDDVDGLLSFGRDFARSSGRRLALERAELQALDPAERLARLLSVLTASGQQPLDLALGRALYETYVSNMRLLQAYVPRPYPGRVALVRMLGNRGDDSHVVSWRQLALGGLDVHEIAGDHFSALRAPTIQTIGDLIRRQAASVFGSPG